MVANQIWRDPVGSGKGLVVIAAGIPIYWYTGCYLLDPSVKNWNALALDNQNYKFIDLEENGTPKLSLAH